MVDVAFMGLGFASILKPTQASFKNGTSERFSTRSANFPPRVLDTTKILADGMDDRASDSNQLSVGIPTFSNRNATLCIKFLHRNRVLARMLGIVHGAVCVFEHVFKRRLGVFAIENADTESNRP